MRVRGEYHFANLMELIGMTHWRERFGDSLNYQIGPDNQGLSSSEAAALAVARTGTRCGHSNFG